MSCVFSAGFKEKTEQATRETWDFTSGKFSARRIFEGPWANRFDFMESELIGSITDVEGNTLFSTLASYPDNPIAIIAKVTAEGRGVGSHNDVTGQAQWERALITVDYSTVPSQDQENQDTSEPANYAQMIGVEESGDVSAERLTIPGQHVVDELGNRLHDEGPFGIPIPLGNISINFPKMIRPNFLLADVLVGAVNDTAFISPGGRAFVKEQIRFDGYDLSLTINVTVLPNGQAIVDPTRLWNVTWRFAYNFWGWNHKLVKGAWVKPRIRGNNATFFRIRNLFQIFFGVGTYGFSKASLDAISVELGRIVTAERNGQDSTSIMESVTNNVRGQLQGLGFNV